MVDPGYYLDVVPHTNEMNTSGWWGVHHSSLVWSGTVSTIPMIWEIFDIFFNNYNVMPVWIEGNYTDPYYDEESGEWTAGLITTVRFKILN